MKHIELNIGMACNNKCRFCMSSRSWLYEKKFTDTKLVIAEIKKYSVRGFTSIGFLGGDISIHPGIYDILVSAKKNGFKEINIITNAMVFSDYDKALQLIESGITRINISIHSHIPEIEDYLTQVKGGLLKKLKAIDNFNRLYTNGLLKSSLSMNIVLNGMNYKNILKTCLYFYKIKDIKDIRINFLRNRYFYTEEDREILEVSYLKAIPYIKQLILFSINTDLKITFDSIPPCIFNKLRFANLDFILKKFLGENNDYIEEISNINQDKVFNWKDQKREELKIKFKNCNKCLYFNKCQGVWKEYIERYSDKEFNPINQILT